MESIENILNLLTIRQKICLLKLIMSMAKKKAMEELYFQMALIMRAKSNNLRLMDMEWKCFQTIQFIQAYGKIIKWMAQENTFGLMISSYMKVKSRKIKKKVKGHILIRMEQPILVNGWMTKSTEMESSLIKMEIW